MSGDDGYSVVGTILGGLAALVVFAGSWLYCISEYGFLVGVSLGWVPSGIVGGIAFGLVRFLWPFLILGGAYLYLRS